MTDIPDIMRRLVERFGENIDSYRAGVYNEAGYAEAYKEVIHEDAV